MIRNDGTGLLENGQAVLAALAKYVDQSRAGTTPVTKPTSLATLSDAMKIREYITQGGMTTEGLTRFVESFLEHSMHLHHPAYLGHQVAVPHVGTALADLMQGMIANPMSIFEMGPGAATIEYEVKRWMLQLIGWHDGAGVLTHGGSIANLHALLSARAAIAPEAWTQGNPADLVVLCSASAHYCVARAISMMGMGSKALIPLPTDAHEVIRADKLRQTIATQRAAGKRIMAVVANACATSTGLYDPVREMADICRQEEVWFHLDSPHGATALLSPKYRHYLDGLEWADSMVWDAHKMMRTSTLCTAVLFRQADHFHQTFTQQASYLIHDKDHLGVDTIPYQIECTKTGLGTKLFLVLASEGPQGLGHFVEKLYDNARTFADLIRSRKGFTSPFPIDSNIICFRYRGGEIDQLALRNRLIATGHYYISTTEVKGVRYLRLVIMNLETTTDTITGLLEQIEQIDLAPTN